MQGQSNCQNTEATSATPLYLYMETIFFYFTSKALCKEHKVQCNVRNRNNSKSAAAPRHIITTVSSLGLQCLKV